MQIFLGIDSDLESPHWSTQIESIYNVYKSRYFTITNLSNRTLVLRVNFNAFLVGFLGELQDLQVGNEKNCVSGFFSPEHKWPIDGEDCKIYNYLKPTAR